MHSPFREPSKNWLRRIFRKSGDAPSSGGKTDRLLKVEGIPVREEEAPSPAGDIARAKVDPALLSTVREKPLSSPSNEPARPPPGDATKGACRPHNYAIGTMLAEGGIGRIHRAQDRNIRRTVAMKVLRDDKPMSQGDVLRFIQEARINGCLEHPNIVPVHELGEDENGKPFYTMKLVQGITLEEILEKLLRGDEPMKRQYPLPALLAIFEKVCDAVAFAHSRGIVHRDLKPGNVMIGDYGEVLVLDWGMAKILREDVSNDAPTEPPPASVKGSPEGAASNLTDGFILGTPNFMAPEQADMRPIDTRTDIYALGGILYNLLTLHPPHKDDPLDKILENIRRGRITPPSAYNPRPGAGRWLSSASGEPRRPSGGRLPHCPGGWIPEPLSLIVMKAMSFEAGDRYQNVRDLQKDIRAYQGGFLTSVETPGLVKSAKLLIKRHQTESFFVAASLFVILALTTIYVIGLVTSQRAQVTALRRQIKAEEEHRRLEEKTAAERRRNWRLVFKDDFSDPNASSRWDFDGPWEVKNNELRMWNSINQVARLKIPIPGDVRLVFDCREESEDLSDVSCFLGSTITRGPNLSFTGGYLFQYGGWYNRRIRLVGPNGILWNRRGSPLVRGKRYHVDARKIGDRLILNVDGQTVIDVRDPNPPHGAEHAHVGFYGYKADTRYENVCVYTRDAAVEMDLLDVAEDFLVRGKYASARDLFQETIDSSYETNRLTRARDGLKRASRHMDLISEFSAIKARLLKTWPKAVIALGENGITINIQGQNIRNLSPLEGLLVSELDCGFNQVESLEPLRGMELKHLFCHSNRISTLEPLRGMPLVSLVCDGNRLSSLEPLRGMRLKRMSCAANQITSLDPLRGMMDLNELNCAKNRITSLDPLRDTELTYLSFNDNQVGSLEPLSGMLLNDLHCSSNRIRDLEPLRGMDLNVLACADNQIASLEPLRGMKVVLMIGVHNPLKNLAPVLDPVPDEIYFDIDRLSPDDWKFIRDRSRLPRYAALLRQAEILSCLKEKRYDRMKTFADRYKNHRYLEVPMLATWPEAEKICEESGGHLLTIASPDEDEHAASLCPKNSAMWMGLISDRQGLRWSTGEPCRFSKLPPGPIVPGFGCVSSHGTWFMSDFPERASVFCVEWDD